MMRKKDPKLRARTFKTTLSSLATMPTAGSALCRSCIGGGPVMEGMTLPNVDAAEPIEADRKDAASSMITEVELMAAAERIREHDRAMRAGAVAYLYMGAEFARMKRGTDHGRFIPWCKQFESIGMSLRTIERMIAAAETFGDKIDTVSNLKISKTAVYAIARDSTPEPIRREFLARIEAGGDRHTIDAAVNEAMAAIHASDERRKQEARRAKMTPEARAKAEKRDQAAQKRREREEARDKAEADERHAAQTEALAILVDCLGDQAERFAGLAERSGFGLSSTAKLVRTANTVIPDLDIHQTEPAEKDPPEPSFPDLDDVLDHLFGDESAPIETPRDLDLGTFAKVRALHDGTDNAGERDAAAGRMRALASSAGLSVEQAVAMVDAPSTDSPHSFSEWFASPELREVYAERQRARDERRAAVLAAYGNEEAAFADTPMEAALRRACEPLRGKGETWQTIYHLDGWGALERPKACPETVRRAVREAWPFPDTVNGAWAEFHAADQLDHDRCALDHAYQPHLYVVARQVLLEEVLNTLPARSHRDLSARMAWMRHWVDQDCMPAQDANRLRLATLSDDIERFAAKFALA